MSKITKKIESWVSAGLLSAQQQSAILDFESKSSNKKSWVLYGIVTIGIAAIAIGVISIIAANWASISAAVKLSIYLLIQTSVGVALYSKLDRPGLVREALIGLFALLFFAGIGLTAQVFHIKSDGWSGVLFWCALALPVMLCSSTRALYYFWVIMLFLAEVIWFFSKLKHQDSPASVVNFTFFISFLVYLKLALGVFSQGRLRLPKYLAEALRTLSFLIVFGGGTVLGTMIWYMGTAEILSGASNELNHFLRLQYVPWLGALLVTPILILRSPPWDKRLAITLSAILFGLALFTTLPVMVQMGPNKLIGTVLTIIIWWGAAMAAVHAGSKRIFDAITLAITVRLLVVYFEVFGSMMATGAGLILSGALILGGAWVWYKFRDQVAKWISS